MSVRESAVEIRCADGVPLAATRLAGGTRGSIVIASAMGAPRKFYMPFARHLAAAGFDALTFDYRGTGDSIGDPRTGAKMRMEDWGRLDIDTALSHARRESHGPLFLVGHSAGAQLPGLAATSEAVDAMVFVAATAPTARQYPPKARLGLEVLWRLAIPALTLGRNRFPARRIGMASIDIPAGVIAQWARWARTPGYMFDPAHGIDTSRYARLAVPILSLRFTDDGYAPPAAVEALLQKFPGCAIERRDVAPSGRALGHFGFFRDGARALWDDATGWLLAQAARSAAPARSANVAS